MTHDDLAAHARAIIDANLYLILGTADPDGRPWTSPVYFAPAGDREFYWLSATDARGRQQPCRYEPFRARW
ncbi:pyridoxamine 5'-phosphate oxidase family protein [Actinopolymorpha pittospori]|uniref:Nitroimidazol reductase NimA-like FMN-containing flavoprotein (Pyridoxamine 5'-phosphate oxidase superfamily) n=1 Tax=Actinopolymorpha pittospori TaxID=648752 RepID=A0A927MTZ8_9ACTN|nr:pyridoxamine 5'-phosphate oxidase family protein [Actinopolymorpha pittospori]MBE1604798.1 nitroimidazol reductase NimA-like FMN-containing flavoprotein (pyridoxamine 5'-phosphate oxidase superfamily) [Actinopolymorpha pittospori]